MSAETRKKILIVDDTSENITVLTSVLNEAYSTYFAKNGRRALEIARNQKPDLILLDVVMPGMSGHEVCRQLKADETTRDIPVIFISAKTGIGDVVKGISFGAVDYIAKPFHADEVLARIEIHLNLRSLQMRLQERTEELLRVNRSLEAEIASRKQAEAALRESAIWLKSMFDSLTEAVFITTPDRKLVDLNPAAEKMFGYTRLEFFALPPEALHADSQAYLEFERRVADAFRKGETAVFEFCARRKNHTVFPTEHSLALILKDDGTPMGVVSVVRDLSEKKQAEEAEHKSERLQGALEMAGTVCHELNQPLMAISGYAELLLARTSPQDPMTVKLHKIKEQVDRMGNLTKNLMDITRYETKAYAKTQIIDLEKAVDGFPVKT